MIAIRTKSAPHWYVHQLRGVVFLTWVSEQDRTRAIDFSHYGTKEQWVPVLSDIAGFELEAFECV